MKSWKEEKLNKTLQGAKTLREYTNFDGSQEDFEKVYRYAYKAFTDIVNDVYSKFCDSPDDECNPDTVEHALNVAVTDAFDDFLRD